MKVGDKVTCTRTIYGYHQEIIHIIGKQYTVTNIFKNIIYLTVEKNNALKEYGHFTEYFTNSFIAIKEERKLKLEKLNGNKR